MKAKTKLTKLWSVLLVLVMVVGMIPIAALATGSVAATADFSADPTTALALLNSAKTSGAADNVWDSTSKTLTLNGVNFETTAATAVKLPDGSTIVLNGDNTIKGGDAASGACYGIFCEGNLTIQGTGTLNVTGGDAATRSCGIYTDNALTISGGTVTATSGDVSGGASLGIYSMNNITISDEAVVTANGGTATNDGSFGINAEKSVIISGGKVKAIGGAGKGSDGLYSGNGQINISGGKVEAFGGDAPSAGGSVGIFAQTSGANVTITGTADVTARGGESASDRSYGIYSRNPVTISGGKVEAFGGEGCYPGYGINKANISGGTVTAASEYGDAINNVTTGSGFKTISFDRNGGSGKMIAYTNADSYILPANGFTAPADKEFMGWSESSTGDVIEDTTVNATDGKTLYAIWKINVADFNADPTAALALLNATKTGTADSEWNSSTNTLTLNGMNFETTAATAVRLPADSTIVLNGVNTIKGGDSNSDYCLGIDVLGNLTIQGTGTLNVTGGATTGRYSSYGIYASRDLTIKSGTVIATGGTVSQDYNSHGIFVYSGYVTIESGTVIATGGTAGEDSCGINSDYVNIKGGKVEATGGTAGVHSYGIYLYENITIEGGTVIAKANTEVMNKAPSALPTAYQWRTSESGAYNKYPDSAYTWNAAHTYLEIKKLEYTVTFDANGGTGTMADVTDVLGDYTLPENGFTAPEGKQFKGWSVDGKEKAVGDKITVSADTTVKAVWEDITYTVNVTNGTASPSQAAAGATVTLTANRAPSGQVFDKWEVVSGSITLADASSATTTFKMPAGDVSVKATYHTHSYGSEWETDASKHWHECSCGDKSAEAAHTAGDWITDTAATETTAGTKHKKCTVCKRVLEIGTIPATGYTIIFDANGGSVTTKSVKTNAEGKLTSLPTPIRSGSYSFDGWYTAVRGGTKITTDYVFSANTTVYAHWIYIGSIGIGGGGGGSVSTYAITVGSAKNGTVTTTPETASKGTIVTLTAVPDKGYTLETITVTDKNGNEIKLTNKGDGEYTFTMPASNIYLEATFMEDNSMLNFFVDVPTDAYYYDAVLWAAENGITSGTGDGTTFSPDAPCTRAQVVTFLWRAAGCPAPKSSENPFTDAKPGTFYYDAMLWAVENGITNGTGDGTTFSPDAVCSRGQIVTFLWRSQKSPAADSVNPFTDVAADAYYANAVLWAVTNGITDGTSDTTFSPVANCTRVQIVTFLYRCLG